MIHPSILDADINQRIEYENDHNCCFIDKYIHKNVNESYINYEVEIACSCPLFELSNENSSNSEEDSLCVQHLEEKQICCENLLFTNCPYFILVICFLCAVSTLICIIKFLLEMKDYNSKKKGNDFTVLNQSPVDDLEDEYSMKENIDFSELNEPLEAW